MGKRIAQQAALTLMFALGFVALNFLFIGIDFIAENYSNILGPIGLIALLAIIIKLVNGVLK